MRQPLPIRTLRRWYRASVGFALLTTVWLGYVLISGPADTMLIVAAGCPCVAAWLNAWNMRIGLRRREAEEEPE